MARIRGALTALILALSPVIAFGADDEPSLEFFYPLVTRRPVIERELELRGRHDKGHEGRRSELAAALEVPAIFIDSREGKGAAGPGDVEVQNKFLLLKSIEHRALLATGFELRLPSGSERRGLGGEAAVEPFLVAAIALGDFDLLGEASYEWNVNAHVQGEREQVLTTGVAVGYRGFRGFTPLVELLTVSQTRGDGNEGLRGKTQVYVVPGLNRRLGPGTTARFGVQLPVADARRADYVLHGGLVWEF